jgi:two-component system LytT family sensor kinase
VEEEALSYAIEPMLLIPFVENAFKHGVGYSGRPGIFTRLSVVKDTLTFEVKNKFEVEPVDSKDESSGIGLGNVISRLNLLYRNKYTLSINDANNLFHIVLTLKLL